MAKRKSDRERMFVVAVGATVAKTRARCGIQQRELAARVGIKQGTLSNYEHGYNAFPLYMLLRVAALLKVPLAELVGPAVQKAATIENGGLASQ